MRWEIAFFRIAAFAALLLLAWHGVRRDGPLCAVAERHAYRLVPAGIGGLRVLGAAMAADTALTARVEAELRAHAAASPWNARGLLERALRVSPALGRGHERLGLIALAGGSGAWVELTRLC